MRVLGWQVERGENRRAFGHAGELLTLRIDVPTVYAYRSPRYGVLWGGRACDVQAGSAQDKVRQAVLNRRARERRMQVLVTLRLRDSMTPVLRGMDRQLRALEAAARPAAEAMAAMGAALARGQGAAGRRGQEHHERMRRLTESMIR